MNIEFIDVSEDYGFEAYQCYHKELGMHRGFIKLNNDGLYEYTNLYGTSEFDTLEEAKHEIDLIYG